MKLNRQTWSAGETFLVHSGPRFPQLRARSSTSLKAPSWCQDKSSLFVLRYAHTDKHEVHIYQAELPPSPPAKSLLFGVYETTPYHHPNISPAPSMSTDALFMPPTPRLRGNKELPPCPDLVDHPQNVALPFMGGWCPRSVSHRPAASSHAC